MWKDIQGYEGAYKVSSTGKVLSVRRSKLLKGKLDKDGYVEYCLCLDGTRAYRRAHRLVALAFLDNPNELPLVNHKDLDKSHNAVCNLEWCTPTYNVVHGYKNQPEKRVGKGLSDLTNTQLLELVSLYKQGKDYTYLEKHYDITVRRDVLGELLSGRRYAEVTGITHDIRRKHNHSGTKLSDLAVLRVYVDYFRRGLTQTDLCSKYNMSPPQIHRIVKGTRRRDLFEKYVRGVYG